VRLRPVIRAAVNRPSDRHDEPALLLRRFGVHAWVVLAARETVALDAGEIVGIVEARAEGRFALRFPGEPPQPVAFDSLDGCLEYFSEYVFALHLGR
jgi:hypothetical protein